MTPLWTSDELAAATGGTAAAAFEAKGVAFDSREIGPGDLFVALKGETTDGHNFVGQALAAGAAGALVEQPIEGPHVLVSDTMAALEAVGRAARARMSGTVFGVTGSVGKTSTKEALFAALDRRAPGAAHRSVKSYNNHTGVPLSLARTPRAARYGVYEMGMNHAGEIRRLTAQVRPHVALITAIAPAHIENLGSLEAIADAKAEIFEGLEPGGTAIIPFAAPHRDRLAAVARRHTESVVTFGEDKAADVHALYAVPAAGGGTMLAAKVGDGQVSFTLPQPGAHVVSNALAVLAAVHAAGADLAAAGLALAELGGMKGRGARHVIALPGGEALLIDESYNANPASMAATLEVLGAEAGVQRRVAILGAMKELGAHSEGLHAALAEPIRAARAEPVILVGEEMAPLARALGGARQVVHVPDASAAIDAAREAVRPGDAILVKGSNSVGLAALVEALAGGA
jgi:UDP-N-acetylmuramoyl-tripeptide--D-alanyl-D-alanine ligase